MSKLRACCQGVFVNVPLWYGAFAAVQIMVIVLGQADLGQHNYTLLSQDRVLLTRPYSKN